MKGVRRHVDLAELQMLGPLVEHVRITPVRPEHLGVGPGTRAQFFYFATVNTPAMTWKLIGKGSQYAWGYLDANGDYLNGSTTYQLNIP